MNIKLNVLVVGGAGYIGSVFTELLLKENNIGKIVVVDNLSTGYKENLIEGIKFYKEDILNSKKIYKILKNEEINFVVHFAAKLIVPESVFQPIDYFENNVGGIISLLKAMRYSQVRNIIFSSTAAVYGNPEEIPVTESSKKDPINPYGSSKLSCEFLLESSKIAYDINYGIIRYFNVAGATKEHGLRKKDPTLLIPVINKSIIENLSFKVFGTDYKTKDGSCIRDYIHVEDLCNAHISLMNYMFENNKSEIINLGSSKGFSVLEVVKEVEKTLDVKLNYSLNDRRQGDPAILITSNEKAKKIIEWTPKLSLSDMIKSDYEFRKKIFK